MMECSNSHLTLQELSSMYSYVFLSALSDRRMTLWDLVGFRSVRNGSCIVDFKTSHIFKKSPAILVQVSLLLDE